MAALHLLLVLSLFTAVTASEMGREILFQGFGWDAKAEKEGQWYRHLGSKAKELSEMGITHVWYPPVSRSVSPQGYMPGDYYDLGTPENPTFYGDFQQLQESIAEFAKVNIKAVADIVINHRTASHQEAGVWNVFHHSSKRMMWEKWALAKDDYAGTGAPDSGGDFAPAPDIDHSSHRVRADIVEWLNWMQNAVGFNGLRLDYTKGYAAKYVKEYVKRTRPEFCVGEYWTSMHYDGTYLLPDQNSHRQETTDWVDGTGGTCATFDFTTKGILQESLRSGDFWRLRDGSGKAAGMIGWWPQKSVTFIDNHDTGSLQAHWPFPQNKLLHGYAYILTHPGIPTIFYEHVYSASSELKQGIVRLLTLRRAHQIHSASQLKILHAKSNLYVAEIDERVILHLGSGQFQAPEGWSQVMLESGLAVYERQPM